jgi:hypothetical protein
MAQYARARYRLCSFREVRIMGDDFLDAWDMKTNSTPDERRTRLNTWRKGRTRCAGDGVSSRVVINSIKCIHTHDYKNY